MSWRRVLPSLALCTSACGSGPAEPNLPPPPAAVEAAPAAPAASLPTLTVEGDDLLLDGQHVGSIQELSSAPGYQWVSGLDEALDAHMSRAAGQSPAPRALRVQLPDELDQQPLVSAFLTASAAGFDDVIATREADELRFRLYQPPNDETPGARMQVIWLRLSEKAAHVTRWPDVEEQDVPAAPSAPRHAALRAMLRQECTGPDGRCYDVAIVSAAPTTKVGEVLEVVEALAEARQAAVDRPPLTIDFGGRAAGPERDPAAMHETLRAGSRSFRACYTAALDQNPELAGRIMVRFMVDRDGSVVAARATDAGTEAAAGHPAVPPLGDPGVLKCVESAFHTLSFEAAGLSTGNYPIVFSK